MKFNDAVIGVLVAALGIAVLLGIQGFPKIPGQPVGPALFPGLVAVGLCVCGLLLIVKGLLARREQAWVAFEDWVRSLRHIRALLVLLGGIVFYMAVSTRLGFLPTAFLMLVALFLALGLSLPRTLLTALLAVLLVHFAFYKLLRVPLPWGVLTPWAW